MKTQITTKYFRNAVAVFEGGGVRGAAYAGAYRAATERGVRIRTVAGTSAGSIAATFVAAGFSPRQMEELFQNAFLKNLLTPPAHLDIKATGILGMLAKLPFVRSDPKAKAYLNLGSYSSEGIEAWLNGVLSEQLNCRGKTVIFGQFVKCPLYVVAANIREAKVKVWSTYDTPEDSVAFAVRSSCSIPFFFQPVSNGVHTFVDGGILSNLPLQTAGRRPQDTESYPVLAFRLESDPEMYPPMPGSSEQMLHQIVDTIISGHSEMEMQMAAPCAQIKIPTGKISSTNFNLSDTETKTLISSGAKATHSFFDEEDAQVANLPSLTRRPEQTDRGMWLDKSMRAMDSAVQQIVLFGGDCSWVFELAPCLILKKTQGLDVRVIYDCEEKPIIDPMEVMPFFGWDVRQSKSRIHLRGALIDSNTQEATVILSDKNPEAASRFGRILHNSTDRRLIEMIRNHYTAAWETGVKSAHNASSPRLRALEPDLTEKALRKVSQYRDQRVSIKYDLINPREICWLTTSLEPFKLTRVGFLVSLLEQLAIDRFKALWIEGTPRIIGPSIVEELPDGRRVLIDGHHRMYYCIENGINQVSAIIIRGVQEPLPASIIESWEHLRVLPQRLPRDERYKNYKARHFRLIGEALAALGNELFKAG